jgi:hypothetical protein
MGAETKPLPTGVGYRARTLFVGDKYFGDNTHPRALQVTATSAPILKRKNGMSMHARLPVFVLRDTADQGDYLGFLINLSF